MDEQQRWLHSYLEQYRRAILQPEIYPQLIQLKELLLATKASDKKAIIAGNGGSAAIASHCAVDLTKNAGVRCVTFNEPDLITCFANDYGYEHWLEKALEFYAEEGDLVILISSSGRSPNMIKAAEQAISRGLRLVTFSGFRPDNPLRRLGELNLWVNSQSYNVVEMTHHIWLLVACDHIIAEAEALAAATSEARQAA